MFVIAERNFTSFNGCIMCVFYCPCVERLYDLFVCVKNIRTLKPADGFPPDVVLWFVDQMVCFSLRTLQKNRKIQGQNMKHFHTDVSQRRSDKWFN